MNLSWIFDKKTKYLIYSVGMGLMVFWFTFTPLNNRGVIAFLTFAAAFAGMFLVQFPNNKFSNSATSLLLPFHMIAGSLLVLTYYPNLAVPIKLASIIALTLCFYIVCIVNNVVLVVEDKKQVIPLYRAAVTWNQILLVIVSIPYLAGIFKIPYIAFVQNIFAGISSFLFTLYVMWILKFDSDLKVIKAGERYTLAFFIAMITFLSGLSVSFFPTESFLRAIFVASIVMSGISYITMHLKNTINKNAVVEFLFISLLFLLILVVFKP
jgi:hypothetical protein